MDGPLSASRAQATIGSLKKEIERAWKMVEASHEKEQRAKETIHNLKVPRPARFEGGDMIWHHYLQHERSPTSQYMISD